MSECTRVEEALTEAMLAHRAPGEDVRAHLAACTACAARAAGLARVAGALAAGTAPQPAPSVLRRTEDRAVAALRERAAVRDFAREAVRAALAALLVAVPVAALHAMLVLRWGERLLGGWLPADLLASLETVYLGALAVTLALLLGSIPLLVAFTRGRGAAPLAGTPPSGGISR